YRTCGLPCGAWRVVARRNAGVAALPRTIACESGSLRRPGRRSDSGSRARACFLRVRRVRDDAVAPGLLRRVERFVGAAQQLLGFLGVIGEDGNPEGNGDGPERLIAISKLELCNFLAHALGPAQRGVERALGQQHQEFLASVAAGDVGPSRGAPERARQLPQYEIARFVAERVVEALEVVDVEHDRGERPAVALRAAQLQAEPLLHVMAVVQAGELVAHRLL